MTGKPVFAASEREKVLFPDPAIPVTMTRRPIVKAALLIDVSVPQMRSGPSLSGPHVPSQHLIAAPDSAFRAREPRSDSATEGRATESCSRMQNSTSALSGH